MDQLKDPLNRRTVQTTALFGKMFPDDLIETVGTVGDTMEALLPTPERGGPAVPLPDAGADISALQGLVGHAIVHTMTLLDRLDCATK